MNKLLKPYIIGETADNHEGDIQYLYKMIDDINKVKLNAVKFHLLLNSESYFQKKHPLNKNIQKWMFNEKEWAEILKYSQKKKMDIIALCDDVESLQFINKNFSEIFAVELHAVSLNDYYLLEEAANFKGKIILGVGGSTLDEIQYAIYFLKTSGKDDLLLMYGFQSYPTNYSDINLSKMNKIRDLFNLQVGYADHTAFNDTNNEIISVMAAMMGYNILEKHYTPDFGVERIDFHAAVGKKQMLKIKELMNLALTVLGNGSLKMSEAELKYGNTGPMKKAIVAKKDIKKGEILSLNNLWFKRTEESSPLKQYIFPQLLGLTTKKDIKEDEIIDFSKVEFEFQKQSLEDFTHKKEA